VVRLAPQGHLAMGMGSVGQAPASLPVAHQPWPRAVRGPRGRVARSGRPPLSDNSSFQPPRAEEQAKRLNSELATAAPIEHPSSRPKGKINASGQRQERTAHRQRAPTTDAHTLRDGVRDRGLGTRLGTRTDIRPHPGREGLSPHAQENRLLAGVSCDGETRTRTGDTTIFSRYVLAAERREIAGNERFLRVGRAPLICAICAGFHAFQGMAGLPSPFWPRGLLRR
jgi:hypothetical protein